MEMAELQAINKRVRTVKAISKPDESEDKSSSEPETTEEAEKKTTRSKKNKKGV